ncbi:MAG: hypothetical protein EKK68_01320 [Candidatus Competibacteraceae bacterium]|nr:MAG: hypothetical protein EKK68_01320 [Candidatus Competibacteraceae bacterium]
MTIILDSHYTIGRLHLSCQDYVCQGWEPFPYVILADGCSSAPDSDLGARLLVLNARRLLSWFALPAVDEAERTARHWRLGRRLVRRAARQARELGVSVDVLDATLLVAWCEGSTVYIHCYGDGCIAVRRADGETAVIQIEYAENAPYYLSYLLDRDRHALYQEAIGDPAIAQTIRYSSKAGVSTRLEPFNSPTLFNFNLMTSPTVTVATDGLHSLVSTETGNRLNVLSVAQAMLDFDDLEPGFIKRQLRQVLADYGQQRVFNLDDLSLGVFVGGN